ncbi:MAG: hypothetical protein M3Q12_12785, partial [Pseudomonadota bacterium]|nr:hypothetical protein [Pseudomonadota bacterium]
ADTAAVGVRPAERLRAGVFSMNKTIPNPAIFSKHLLCKNRMGKLRQSGSPEPGEQATHSGR